MARATQRRHVPPHKPLTNAVTAEQNYTDALAAVTVARGRAFLAAAEVGWSMREIATATGLSPSTVCRIINAAELVG